MAITVKTQALSDGCIKVTVTGLTKASYGRHLICNYKLSSDSSYTKWGQAWIASNDTPDSSYVWNVGGVSTQSLIPGKTYNIQVIERNYTTGKAVSTKYASAKTQEASGSFSVEVTPSSITWKISGLKSTASYVRTVDFCFAEDPEGYKTGDCYLMQADIAAGATAPNLVSSTWTDSPIRPGKTLYAWAKIYGYGYAYKSFNYVTVTIPIDGISRADITSVTYTQPERTISVGVQFTYYEPTFSTTTFELYLRRESGDIIDCGSLDPEQAGSTYDINVSPWLYDDEAVALWVVSSEPDTPFTAVSPEYRVTIGRLFHWDAEKKQGEEFNFTDDEWNRMIAYGQRANELYPQQFTRSFQIDTVSAGDVISAADATEIGMGSAAIEANDAVLAEYADNIEEYMQESLSQVINNGG